MLASQVISTLQNLVAAHGDLEVGVLNSEFLKSEGFDTITVKDSNWGKEPMWPDDQSLGPRFFLIS